ncbi:hypothetical protein Vqi01_18800 [Micromonospora qiuiae]|uniref:ATP-grasp domain-containing protein n=1 Tax=Micromonospora qiuiae TaxID=502268 RepID=A0ABQ4J9E0_9ACTN|nr:ATP-grasp domain-containing protein [Micromonospora qiuiae]GIJ26718.1 hypothetical protein Vqi01_18800 [Micromonospora qiuiae]
MSRSTVLVLGCASTTPHGRDQMRRLSAQARGRGVRLVGADTPANLRAFAPKLVDDVVAFPVHDAGAARSWAATYRERIDAVMTFREMCVESVAAIADERKLAGNRPDAVRTIRTKDLCRQALRAAGFRQPACAVVTDEPSARHFLATTAPGPWIVKPRDGMGSVGVSLVADSAELARAIARLNPGAPFLIETFVAGPEFSAEGVVCDQAPVVLSLTAKSTGAGFVETGHRVPAQLDAATATLARQEVERALRTVGITHGIFHVEFWLDGPNVVLGEIHARPGGDFIHAMVEHVHPDLELYGALIDDLLDVAVPPLPAASRAAGAEFLVLPAGRVRRVQGWAELYEDHAVLAADLPLRAGDLIRPVHESADRHGVLVLGAADPAELETAFQRLRKMIQIEVEPVGAA